MTINEYQALALRTARQDMSQQDVLVNCAMGLCGETGEACDLIKKHVFHGHELDREKLVKELGDVAWYLARAAAALDVPLETVLQKNIEKLARRYPEGFSQEKSIHREE